MHDSDAPDRLESPPSLSRRRFLTHAGAAGLAGIAASIPLVAAAAEVAPLSTDAPVAPDIPGTVPIALRINGETHKIRIDPRATLLDTLRETVHLMARRRAATTDSAAPAPCT